MDAKEETKSKNLQLLDAITKSKWEVERIIEQFEKLGFEVVFKIEVDSNDGVIAVGWRVPSLVDDTSDVLASILNRLTMLDKEDVETVASDVDSPLRDHKINN